MAKLAVSFTLLCLFFAFSHARLPADLPLNDAVSEAGTEISTSTTGDILLPSAKPQSDPESTAVQVKVEENHETDDGVPLTMISFRPVNRHFPRRPFPLTLSHGRRCRLHYKPWGPRRGAHGDVIPFGDDMILSGGDRLRMGSDPVFHGGVRQIPPRWIQIHHKEPRFPLGPGDEIEWPHHHHHHHHHRHHDHDHHHHHDHEEGEHEHKHEHENVFLKSFRKFMNHF